MKPKQRQKHAVLTKRKGDRYLIFFLVVLLSTALFVWGKIKETKATFIENFNTTDYMDPTSTVSNWGNGFITLHKKYFMSLWNSDSGKNLVFPNWIDTVTANDFDGDGISDLIVTCSDYANVLAVVQATTITEDEIEFTVTHWIDGSQGDNEEPTLGVGGSTIDSSGYCGLTSGDYDLDGDNDFFFVCSAQDSPYAIKRIWLYKNNLIETGVMSFTLIDLTGQLSSGLGGIGWSSTMMVSVDFDFDDDVDIVFGNKDGQVFEISNLDGAELDSETFLLETEPLFEVSLGSRGINALSCGDFNSDGYYDILIGGKYSSLLYIYWNDETNEFEEFESYQLPDVDDQGPVGAFSQDFDRDGDQDIVLVLEKGEVYYFHNSDSEFTVSSLLSRNEGLDFGAVMDIDSDGISDLLVGDRFDEGEGDQVEAFLFVSEISDYYNLMGTAYSGVVAPDQEFKKLITKVKVKNLQLGYLGKKEKDMRIFLYFSNDGGENWILGKEFKDGDLKKTHDIKDIKFKGYGSELVWKAEFVAKEDKVELEEASEDTPVIYGMELEYSYIDEMEFSRSSSQTASIKVGDQTKNVVIAATFIYPSLEGHLRAYDMTTMLFDGESQYSLKTVSEQDVESSTGRSVIPEGVEILWDAGDLLKETHPMNRNIYTSVPNASTGELERIDFIEANDNILKKYVKKHKKHDRSVYDFVRGEDRPWKLAWIDHSTPAILRPPKGNASLKGDGYLEFKNTWSNRAESVIVGGNGGMFNCFDLATGAELWGYIPFNLLYPLKKMIKDRKKEAWYFNPKGEYYVDGRPVIEDVYIDKDGDGNKEWITMLLIGQGKGKGKYKRPKGEEKKGKYFYNALDITNPENPQPLWEFSPDKIGQTWSTPAVGKVRYGSEDYWVAFVGSGYKAKEKDFYIIDLSTGDVLWSFRANAEIPGSPAIIDIDQNGFVDRVYVGDLKGTMWRVDLTQETWTAEDIYQDAEEYPIITKPALWCASGETTPHVYFGTGGDDKAKDDKYYSFIALIDGEEPEAEWFIGDKGKLKLKKAEDMGKMEKGEKVWADPVISDGVVYFSTFEGNIEDVDPVKDEDLDGKLYARYIDVSSWTPGSTAFSGSETYLVLKSKTRAAVTVGGMRENEEGTRERDVFIHEYDSTLQVLSRGGGTLTGHDDGSDGGDPAKTGLRIRSWREVYRIIK